MHGCLARPCPYVFLQATCSDPLYANAFFTQWALHGLPDNGRYKSLQLLPPGDQSKVDTLLAQFNPGGELTTWCEHVYFLVVLSSIVWHRFLMFVLSSQLSLQMASILVCRDLQSL